MVYLTARKEKSNDARSPFKVSLRESIGNEKDTLSRWLSSIFRLAIIEIASASGSFSNLLGLMKYKSCRVARARSLFRPRRYLWFSLVFFFARICRFASRQTLSRASLLIEKIYFSFERHQFSKLFNYVCTTQTLVISLHKETCLKTNKQNNCSIRDDYYSIYNIYTITA